MATAQASSTPASATGPDAAASSSAPHSAAGEAAASSDGAANSAASSVKDGGAAAPASKAASPSPAQMAMPIRDKESYNRLEIDRFITRDWLHSAALDNSQDLMKKIFHHQLAKSKEYMAVRRDYKQWFPTTRLYGEGYQGYGNGFTETGGPSRIVYPQMKPRPGRRATQPVKYSRKDMKLQAEQHEELVPVRLDVDWDKVKLRDTFTWNLHERVVPIEVFAAHLIEDMGLKAPLAQPVYDQVLQQIQEQLNDFYPIVFSEEDALDPELPYSAYKNDEMRILVKLNITIGQHTLVDQFEWEINNPNNSPEEFAASMSRDLALSGEFTTAIAHCIREQTHLFTRSLYSIGHPFDGRPIEDPDLVTAFLPSPLPTVFRPQQQAKEYAPYLYELSDADLERNEVIFSREQRRQKRSVNRRGGPQLPDLKERQRTIRTLVVSSVLPGAALDEDESRLYKRAAGTAGPGRKRAARDGDLSESEDSDDSTPDSPAMSQLQGTARTRGMRGAASAAQQRMANLGRSETPEAGTIHHHETRTNRRVTRDLRDSTEEPDKLIVVLRLPKEKLKKITSQVRSKHSTPSGMPTPVVQHQRAPSAAATGSMGPPSTPSALNQGLPSKSSTPSSVPAASQLGRVPAPPPAPPGQSAPPPPPPPQWLTDALAALSQAWPNDSFEPVMRYCAINAKTDQPLPAPAPGAPIPEDMTFVYLPRIRCLDCPGKLYTPGPEMGVGNFEVHLKNRQHREKAHKDGCGGSREEGENGEERHCKLVVVLRLPKEKLRAITSQVRSKHIHGDVYGGEEDDTDDETTEDDDESEDDGSDGDYVEDEGYAGDEDSMHIDDDGFIDDEGFADEEDEEKVVFVKELVAVEDEDVEHD
ncbi:uncharacterized protein E0L32_005728 [Thyridium curvatum]|uniref:Uncharacterized protein n=1 Tax=Thyridium curvatum TaxID=1093900 RepID=A0A507B507_9PEZI|nr:uncharacterized protein E0L32_005728 [Thyridium curvatum]TPX13784.1 hypothetical protein E0L32_005728 [Thyridium curvatum]